MRAAVSRVQRERRGRRAHLGKLLQLGRGVARGRDEHARVVDARLGVLVVDVGQRGCVAPEGSAHPGRRPRAVERERTVLGSVHAHLALACAMSARGLLALCEEVLYGLLALPDLLLLLLERLLVEELAALASLATELVRLNPVQWTQREDEEAASGAVKGRGDGGEGGRGEGRAGRWSVPAALSLTLDCTRTILAGLRATETHESCDRTPSSLPTS